MWWRMLGGECGWNVSNRRSGVVSKSAMPPKKSSSRAQQTLFACGETVLSSFFQPGVVLIFRWNSNLAVLRQTVLRHPTVLLLLRRATGEPLGSDPADRPDHNVHFFTSDFSQARALALRVYLLLFSKATQNRKSHEIEIDPRGRYDNSGTQARGRYGKKL